MSKSIKMVLAIGLVAMVTACAQQQQEEEVPMVIAEPTSSKL